MAEVKRRRSRAAEASEVVDQGGLADGTPNGRANGTPGGLASGLPDTPTTAPPDAPPPARFTSTGLPAPPGATARVETFFEYLAALRESDWEHLTAYVYRAWPKINRPRGERYVLKFTGPFTQASIHDLLWSGDYQVRLNDQHLRGQFQTVIETTWSYRDPERPPKLSLDELDIGDKVNRDYVESLKRDGILTSEGEIVEQVREESKASTIAVQTLADLAKNNQSKAAQPSASIDSAVVAEAIKAFGLVNTESVKMALKQSDPEFLMKLLGMMQGALGQKAEAGKADPTVLTILMAQLEGMRGELAEERKANRELLGRILDANAKGKETESPIAQLKELLQVRDLLTNDTPDALPKNWKEAAVQAVTTHMPEILDTLRMFAGSLGKSAAPAPAAATTARPAIAASTSTPNPAPAGETPAAPAPAGASTPIEEMKAILTEHGAYFVRAFNNGMTGDDFADTLTMLVGLPAYRKLTQHGPQVWIEAINQMPELAEVFIGQQKQLLQFLEDFFRYEEPGPDEDAETEPAAPKPPKRAKSADKKGAATT